MGPRGAGACAPGGCTEGWGARGKSLGHRSRTWSAERPPPPSASFHHGCVQLSGLVQQTFSPWCPASFHKLRRGSPHPPTPVKALEPGGGRRQLPLLSRELRALGGVSGLRAEDRGRLGRLPACLCCSALIRWGRLPECFPRQHPLLSPEQPDAVYAASPESQCTVLFKGI